MKHPEDPRDSSLELIETGVAAAEVDLDLWLDGDLDDASAEAVARRLAEEPELRREMRAASLLRRRVAELPREKSPQSDLWPGIAERLEAKPSAVPRGPWGQDLTSRRSTRSAGWRQALAALLGVALGATLTFAVLTGSKEAGDVDVNSDETTWATAPASEFVNAGYGGDLSSQIEADFLRARESLWVQVFARRDRLPPETWTAVVENLGLLDRVIRELRQALDENPGNRRLERLLRSNHQRQLDVLNKVTREV